MADDGITVDRLNRIEQKIDQLSVAVVSIARVEERMVSLFRRMDAYEQREREIDDRVANLENTESRRGYILGFIDRLWWIIITVVATSITWYFKR